MQKQIAHQQTNHKEHKDVPFKLYKGDLQDLFLKLQGLPRSLVKDINQWVEIRGFKGFLYHEIFSWFHEEKQRIDQTARQSHKIIDNLLVEKIPSLVIEVYMQLLLKSKSKIEKELKVTQAEELFKYIPTELIVDYLDLYHINLTEKEKDNIMEQLLTDKRKSLDKIDRLPAVFKDRQKYSDILVHKLSKMGRNDLAADVIKKYKLPLKKYEDIQLQLIQNSARSMPNWEKEKFCWEILEQVYCAYPSAIAACINILNKQKKAWRQYAAGFASIVNRIPEVAKYLPNDIKNKLKEIKDIIPNKLRHNRFEPSDPKAYFSLIEFGITEKDVIWVDATNYEDAIHELFKSHIIGIDTESTVVRTTLSTSFELLSIVQISNQRKIFVFDAFFFKRNPIKSQIVDDFFKNEKNIIVGHTLAADLNEDVTKLFGFHDKVSCQKIDICPIFKKHYPGKRAGLAHISQAILGKQICKAYTLTYWDRRPLFRNQIHYAALDALIVLKIWDILKEKHQANKEKTQSKQVGKENSKQ